MSINSAALSMFNNTFAAAPAGQGQGTTTGTVSSSKYGNGTFVSQLEEVNGQKVINKTVTYADGTTVSTERAVTINDDGSKTITRTGKNGKTSTIEETKTLNDDGSYSISEQVTHANGSVTQVSGTETKSKGETDKVLTSTNAKGKSETLDHQKVKDGNSTTYTTTGTNYAGDDVDNTSTWTTLV